MRTHTHTSTPQGHLRVFSVIKRFIQHCPHPDCVYAASAVGDTKAIAEGRALRSLAAHYVKAHGGRV